MGVTVIQVSPLQEVVNRSILLSSIDDMISLNLSLYVNSQVQVLCCEVYWQQCVVQVLSMTMTESFAVQFSLSSIDNSGSPLHYLLLSVTEIESSAVQLYERLLVVIQNSLIPTLYTRSLVGTVVTNLTSSDVLIGAAVSSLEANLCSQVCPAVNVSLFSVGLVEVDISDWEGVSVRLVGCTSLPSQYWMSYNSYVFSIEWDNVSSELNGKYELRIDVSGLSSGVSELSIDYPVAGNVCEGRLEMGVYWNWTRNGTSSVIPCSQLLGHTTNNMEYSDQFMERSCDSNSQWSDISIECSFSGDITQVCWVVFHRYITNLPTCTCLLVDFIIHCNLYSLPADICPSLQPYCKIRRIMYKLHTKYTVGIWCAFALYTTRQQHCYFLVRCFRCEHWTDQQFSEYKVVN